MTVFFLKILGLPTLHHMDLHTKGMEISPTIWLSDEFYLIIFEKWLLWSYVFLSA